MIDSVLCRWSPFSVYFDGVQRNCREINCCPCDLCGPDLPSPIPPQVPIIPLHVVVPVRKQQQPALFVQPQSPPPRAEMVAASSPRSPNLSTPPRRVGLNPISPPSRVPTPSKPPAPIVVVSSSLPTLTPTTIRSRSLTSEPNSTPIESKVYRLKQWLISCETTCGFCHVQGHLPGKLPGCPKLKVDCMRCGGIGHWRRDCKEQFPSNRFCFKCWLPVEHNLGGISLPCNESMKAVVLASLWKKFGSFQLFLKALDGWTWEQIIDFYLSLVVCREKVSFFESNIENRTTKVVILYYIMYIITTKNKKSMSFSLSLFIFFIDVLNSKATTQSLFKGMK